MTRPKKSLQTDGPGRLSPEFTPHPGWGGRLTAWSRGTGRPVIIRLGLVIAAALAIGPALGPGRDLLSPEHSPVPTPSQNISVTVESGTGLTHATRAALYEYLALQSISPALEPGQLVFAEDWLVRRMAPYTPKPGEVLQFPYEVLAAAVLKAQSLTLSERAAWSRFTPRTKSP